MAKLLCVGGPLDGERRELAENQDRVKCQAGTSSNLSVDRMAVGHECKVIEIATYWRRFIYGHELLVLAGSTPESVVASLLAHYRPGCAAATGPWAMDHDRYDGKHGITIQMPYGDIIQLMRDGCQFQPATVVFHAHPEIPVAHAGR